MGIILYLKNGTYEKNNDKKKIFFQRQKKERGLKFFFIVNEREIASFSPS